MLKRPRGRASQCRSLEVFRIEFLRACWLGCAAGRTCSSKIPFTATSSAALFETVEFGVEVEDHFVLPRDGVRGLLQGPPKFRSLVVVLALEDRYSGSGVVLRLLEAAGGGCLLVLVPVSVLLLLRRTLRWIVNDHIDELTLFNCPALICLCFLFHDAFGTP